VVTFGGQCISLFITKCKSNVSKYADENIISTFELYRQPLGLYSVTIR